MTKKARKRTGANTKSQFHRELIMMKAADITKLGIN
jgi:hypothetical protein